MTRFRFCDKIGATCCCAEKTLKKRKKVLDAGQLGQAQLALGRGENLGQPRDGGGALLPLLAGGACTILVLSVSLDGDPEAVLALSQLGLLLLSLGELPRVRVVGLSRALRLFREVSSEICCG